MSTPPCPTIELIVGGSSHPSRQRPPPPATSRTLALADGRVKTKPHSYDLTNTNTPTHQRKIWCKTNVALAPEAQSRRTQSKTQQSRNNRTHIPACHKRTTNASRGAVISRTRAGAPAASRTTASAGPPRCLSSNRAVRSGSRTKEWKQK